LSTRAAILALIAAPLTAGGLSAVPTTGGAVAAASTVAAIAAVAAVLVRKISHVLTTSSFFFVFWISRFTIFCWTIDSKFVTTQ